LRKTTSKSTFGQYAPSRAISLKHFPSANSACFYIPEKSSIFFPSDRTASPFLNPSTAVLLLLTLTNLSEKPHTFTPGISGVIFLGYVFRGYFGHRVGLFLISGVLVFPKVFHMVAATASSLRTSNAGYLG
jgi:hypothetical protein